MSPKEYIHQRLNSLEIFQELPEPKSQEELIELIYKLVMSKKFRKYSANLQLQTHIKEAIKINVVAQKPINFTFVHGAYKLWRLEESPEADWAELFSLVYFTNWVKNICTIYKPGVWFDFYVDDLIIHKLNNIPLSDIETYLDSFQKLLMFIKKYQPKNLKMTITKVSEQFNSPDEFYEKLQINIEKISKQKPQFSNRQLEMVELNAKPTREQLNNPKWREEIHIVHDAYLSVKKEADYHFNRQDKILVFNQPLPSGSYLAVGTTKTSVAKFWVGIGVLIKKDEGYIESIYSPSQIESANLKTENIDIEGLKGKNFNRIKIVE
jgi:hypothetical protein